MKRQTYIMFLFILVFALSSVSLGKYSGGFGTAEEPYLISTPNDLNSIGLEPNDWDKHFKMIADINMAGYINNEYSIICGSPSGGWYTMFEGVFDGNGHSISNLKLDVNRSMVGLFGYIGRNGLAQNVYLEGIDIKGIHYVGGIAGRNEGVIQNCHVSGTIEGQQECGGITGACLGPWPDIPEIRNSSFRGQVRGTRGTGGIVGSTDGPEIVKCYTIAEIIGEVQCGGIVGHNMGGNLKLCFSKGTITCSQNSAGGFTGITEDHCRIGGDIHDCYADVIVNCNNEAGGFSGSAPGQYGQIRNCYCSGKVVYDVNNYADVGGFIGEERLPHGVFCSYFLETAGPDNGFGEPLSEVQMKQQTSFTGWDFFGETSNGYEDIWRMCQDGVDYPHLAWEFYNYGDLTCPDGVDFLDYSVLADQWQLERLEQDYNSDGRVNFKDYAEFANNWGVSYTELSSFLARWLARSATIADIAPARGDGFVDWQDLMLLCENWLSQ